MNEEKYPQEFIAAIEKASRPGGRLLFIEEGQGLTCKTYTGYIAFTAVLGVVSCTVFEDLPTVVNTAFMSLPAIRKALTMMEAGKF